MIAARCAPAVILLAFAALAEGPPDDQLTVQMIAAPPAGPGPRAIAKVNSNMDRAAFSPSGKLLAFGSGRYGVEIIDVEKGAHLAKVDFGYQIEAVFFSADEKLLGIIDRQKAGLAEVATGKVLGQNNVGGPAQVAVIDPDGKGASRYAFNAGIQRHHIDFTSQRLELWQPVQTLPAQPGTITHIPSFTADGRKYIDWWSGDGLILSDNFGGAPQKLGLAAPTRYGDGFALSPDGTRLLTIVDKDLVLFELPSKKELGRLAGWGQYANLTRLLFSPSGASLFVFAPAPGAAPNTVENRAMLLDPDSLAVQADLGKLSVKAALFAPGGKSLALFTEYEYGPPEKLGEIVMVEGPLAAIETAAAERATAAGKTIDEALAALPAAFTDADVAKAEEAIRAAAKGAGSALPLGLGKLYLKAGRPAQARAALASAQGPEAAALAAEVADLSLPRDLTPRPSLFDGMADKPFLVLETGRHTQRVSRVLYASGGKEIVTASWDKTIRVWDAQSFALKRTLRVPSRPGSEGQIFTLAISPDGKLLAAAGYSLGAGDVSRYRGDYVLLIDYATGKILDAAFSHKQAIFALAFSRDGKKLASGGGETDQEVIVHAVEGGKLRKLYNVHHESLITDLQFDLDDERVLVAQYAGFVGHATPPQANGKSSAQLVGMTPARRMALVMKKDCLPRTCAFMTAQLSPDGKLVAAGLEMGGAAIYETEGDAAQPPISPLREKKLALLAPQGEGATNVLAWSPDGAQLAFSKGKTIFVYDTNSWDKPRLKFDKHDNAVLALAFSADGKRIASSGGTQNQVYVWDATTGEVIGQLGGDKGAARIWALGGGRSRAALVGFGTAQDGKDAHNEYGQVHEAFDLEQLRVLPRADAAQFVTAAEANGNTAEPAFAADFVTGRVKSWLAVGGEFVFGTEFGVYRRAAAGGVARELSHEGVSAFALARSADGATIFAGLADGRVQIFDAASSALVATLLVAGEEWVLWTPAGHYAASRNGARSVGWQVNHGFDGAPSFYPFEQFDLRLNRPDEVLSRIGGVSKRRIDAIRAAVARRQRRMGLSDAALASGVQAPSVELSEVPQATKKKSITLTVKAADAAYPLDRLQVWVNDVPLEGEKGIALGGQEKSAQREVKIELTAGRNKIQVSALNAAGLESLKETRYATFEGKPPKAILHVVAVGVSDYANAEYRLDYAAKDARDVAALAKRAGKAFKKVESITLLDRAVTIEGVAALKKKLAATKVDDEVILFFAGHGLLDDQWNYYFGTADIDFEKPAARGLPYEAIEGLLDGIPARRKLLLVDTCHAGEIDKESAEAVAANAPGGATVKARAVGTRGVRRKAALPAEASVQSLADAVGELLNDLRRGSGAAVIASAGGAEYALESSDLKNGVFTWALLNGLGSKAADKDGDGRVRVSELRDYVAEQVKALTAGKQTPAARRENLEFDFPVF